VEEIEHKINELNNRISKIEAQQAIRDATLQNIEKKIDHIVEINERNDMKYQNREHCEQLSQFQAERSAVIKKQIETTASNFEAHMKDHYSTKDRALDWLWKGLFTAVVLAKMGNLF
jgi:chromosome segregation ATPase